MSIMQKFKEYTPEDKQALRDLQEECAEKFGKEVTKPDLLRALEPGEKTPEHLRDM